MYGVHYIGSVASKPEDTTQPMSDVTTPPMSRRTCREQPHRKVLAKNIPIPSIEESKASLSARLTYISSSSLEDIRRSEGARDAAILHIGSTAYSRPCSTLC